MSTRGSARGTAGQEKRAGQALQVNSTLVHVVNVAISDTPTASDSIQLRIILDCGGREDAPTEALFDVMGTLQVAGFASKRSEKVAEVLDSLEGRDEFEGNESLLVALDVLQQELVLGDVGIGEVELNLS